MSPPLLPFPHCNVYLRSEHTCYIHVLPSLGVVTINIEFCVPPVLVVIVNIEFEGVERIHTPRKDSLGRAHDPS